MAGRHRKMKPSAYAALIFVLFPTIAFAIDFDNHEERIMDESRSQAPQLPPEVAMYIKDAPPESKQFDFLIGDWDVAATKYKADGTVLTQYKAIWSAQYLNNERMIMDDFKALAPTGARSIFHGHIENLFRIDSPMGNVRTCGTSTSLECRVARRMEGGRNVIGCDWKKSKRNHCHKQDSLLQHCQRQLQLGK